MVMETFKWMEMKTTDYDVHLFEQTQSDFIIWLKYKKICYTFLLHGTKFKQSSPLLPLSGVLHQRCPLLLS